MIQTPLQAEIVAIGTEILLGDIVNTNASYLARGLARLGINTYHQEVVGDNPERLTRTLAHCYESSNLVITSGGLGPTGDDLSKETAAAYLGARLVMDEKAREHIESYLTRRGREVTPNNWKQAMLPEGCVPFYNDNGTAPGFALEKDGKILIMLPGPPSELVPMFDRQVLPYLSRYTDTVMVSRTLHLCGPGESYIESRLHEDMMKMTNPTLAPYAKEGTVDLRITAKASSRQQAQNMILPVEQKIREMFTEAVFGADSDTMESVVAGLLKGKGYRMATAESCTGGMAAARMVNFPGVSDVFNGGIVSYSNEAKVHLLGVSPSTLDRYGAVSEQTAREMAAGACKALNAQAAVSTTGIAGPGGGTAEKPVGTVCFGVCVNGKISSYTYHFARQRNSNRLLASVCALNLLRLALLHE